MPASFPAFTSAPPANLAPSLAAVWPLISWKIRWVESTEKVNSPVRLTPRKSWGMFSTCPHEQALLAVLGLQSASVRHIDVTSAELNPATRPGTDLVTPMTRNTSHGLSTCDNFLR